MLTHGVQFQLWRRRGRWCPRVAPQRHSPRLQPCLGTFFQTLDSLCWRGCSTMTSYLQTTPSPSLQIQHRSHTEWLGDLPILHHLLGNPCRELCSTTSSCRPTNLTSNS